MEMIELQRMIHRDPPNLILYTFMYTFTQGLFFVIMSKLWAICSEHSKNSKMVFVGMIILSKLPVGIFYLLRTAKNRLQEVRTPSVISIKNLIIPAVFRILLYAVVLLVMETSKTYYFAIGFTANLVVGELLFQVNTIQTESNLRLRLVGVFLISAGAIIGVTDTHYNLNPNLYLIFLATSIFVIHGETYLNSKLLKLYKPSS